MELISNYIAVTIKKRRKKVHKGVLQLQLHIPEVARNCQVDTIVETSRYYRQILDFIRGGLVNSLLRIYQCIYNTCANLDKGQIQCITEIL